MIKRWDLWNPTVEVTSVHRIFFKDAWGKNIPKSPFEKCLETVAGPYHGSPDLETIWVGLCLFEEAFNILLRWDSASWEKYMEVVYKILAI